jgi:hypothetical protein
MRSRSLRDDSQKGEDYGNRKNQCWGLSSLSRWRGCDDPSVERIELGGCGRKANTGISPLRFASVEMTASGGLGRSANTGISPLRFASVEMTAFDHDPSVGGQGFVMV